MTNDISLNQRAARGRSLGSDIPRFRPRTGGDVTSVPGVQPSAAQAEQQLAQTQQQIAGQAQEAAVDTFNRVQEAVQEQREDRLEQQAADAKTQREALENAGLQELASIGLNTSRANSLTSEINRIRREESDPQAASARMQAVIDGTISQLSEDEAAATREITELSIRPEIAELADQQREQARQAIIQENREFLGNTQSEALRNLGRNSSGSADALAGAKAKYKAALENDPSLSNIERQAKFTKFETNLKKKAAVQSVAQSDNPVSTALNISTGDSEFGELPADVAQTALSLGTQIRSARENLRQQREDAQEEQRRQQLVNQQAEIFAKNLPTEQDLARANQMIENAQTSEELDDARKVRNYIEGEQRKQFTQSDPRVEAAIDVAIARGDLPPDQLRDTVTKQIGNGLSVQAARRQLSQIENNQNALLQSDAFDVLKTDLEEAFPQAFGSENESVQLAQTLTAIQSGDTEALNKIGRQTSPEKRQQKLSNSSLQQIRELVIDGEIASQSDLLERGRKIIQQNEARLNIERTAAKKLNVQDFDISGLPEQKQRAFRNALGNEKAVRLANDLYLGNEERFLDDVEQGKLEGPQIDHIGTLIQTTKRLQDNGSGQ